MPRNCCCVYLFNSRDFPLKQIIDQNLMVLLCSLLSFSPAVWIESSAFYPSFVWNEKKL